LPAKLTVLPRPHLDLGKVKGKEKGKDRRRERGKKSEGEWDWVGGKGRVEGGEEKKGKGREGRGGVRGMENLLHEAEGDKRCALCAAIW